MNLDLNPGYSVWRLLNVPAREEFLMKFVLKETFQFTVQKGDTTKTISIKVRDTYLLDNSGYNEWTWCVEGFYFVGCIDTKLGIGSLSIQDFFMDSIDS